MRKYSGLWLALIVALAVVSGFFVYPKSPWADKWQPWHLGLDLAGGAHLVYRVDLSKVNPSDQQSVLDGLRDVIERRVNLFGVSEPQVYVAKSGDNSELVVELAGVTSVDQAIKNIGETPILDFREIEQGPSSTINYVYTNLDGQYITGAQLTYNQTTGAPEVAISFNDEGGKIFEQITEKNIGKPLAIFLDNALISAPTVQGKISGGNAVINGVSLAEAKEMIQRFNAGALPAPIKLVDQMSISPSLGKDSLESALWAGLIGTLLVMIFMIGYYRKLGIFASLALIIYISLTLGAFKIFAITMTLAGVAGFILTIGMAVDANILIFERVKEELKKGLSHAAAMHEGFRRAWPSIRDSNTSTFITAAILYFFTTSFVKGFALNLAVGVAISLFSAITTTRLFLEVFMKDKKAK
ncbi:MAG TPA: protein translocase subunit SecD [Candidatus Paceibacterota bacterium]